MREGKRKGGRVVGKGGIEAIEGGMVSPWLRTSY